MIIISSPVSGDEPESASHGRDILRVSWPGDRDNVQEVQMTIQPGHHQPPGEDLDVTRSVCSTVLKLKYIASVMVSSLLLLI